MDFVQSIMGELNRNLAAERIPLSEAIGKDCSYRLRDGSVIDVSKEQIQCLWDACDDSEKLRLKIPIYIGTDVNGEIPAWKVEGTAEVAVVAKLLNKKTYKEGYLRLYNPDLKTLKSKISDCILMVFTP